jgi:hypothetical protein
MNKLVDDVGGAEPTGVVDRRLAEGVIGDDADEVVANATALIADGPDRDRLEPDRVALEPEARLPQRQPAIDCGRGGGRSRADNESQYR